MASTTLAQASGKANGGSSPAATVTALLTKNFGAIRSCLPKHLTPERMCRIAVQTMQTNPKLLKCSAESLVACVIEASSLGLEIDSRGLAYIVPYNSDGGGNATLIFGYKGLMELAYRSGRVSSIYAETVCDNDEFIFELGLRPKLEHTPNLDERGELRAVYAVAHMKDADPVFVVLGKKDVHKVRDASKAGKSGPWAKWEEEMWKKTAIRRLCKYLPLSAEMSRAIAMDEMADAGKRPQYVIDGLIDLPEEAYLDAEAVKAVEAAQAQPPKTEGSKRKAESGALESPKEAPPLEPGDIICPKINADGSPQIVDGETCGNCKERAGCPAWE